MKSTALLVCAALCVVASGVRAGTVTVPGTTSGTATANFTMPSSADPDTLTFTNQGVYTTDDQEQLIDGNTFLPSDSNGKGGLVLFDQIPDPNNPRLFANIVEVKVTTTYTGTLTFNTLVDPNASTQQFVPWSVSAQVIGGTSIFDFRQVPGSAVFNANAFHGFVSGDSADPLFATSPFTFQGFTQFQPVPETSSYAAIATLLAACGVPLLRRRRKA